MALPLDEEEKRKKQQQSAVVEKVGTATRVGDTLYGSSTGVTPDNFTKAQNYLNTQSTLDKTIRDPKATLPDMVKATAANDSAMESALNSGLKNEFLGKLEKPPGMVEVAPGVRMSQDSADKYYATNSKIQSDTATALNNQQKALDTFATAQANNRSALAEKAQASIDRYNKFRDVVGAPEVTFGQEREDEKNIQQLASMEQKAASRALRDARAARRDARNARDPIAASEAANAAVYAAEKRLGPSNDAEVRSARFLSNARDSFYKNRLNPYSTTTATPTAPSATPAPPVSLNLNSAPGVSLLTGEDEDQDPKRRKTGRELDLTTYS